MDFYKDIKGQLMLSSFVLCFYEGSNCCFGEHLRLISCPFLFVKTLKYFGNDFIFITFFDYETSRYTESVVVQTSKGCLLLKLYIITHNRFFYIPYGYIILWIHKRSIFLCYNLRLELAISKEKKSDEKMTFLYSKTMSEWTWETTI